MSGFVCSLSGCDWQFWAGPWCCFVPGRTLHTEPPAETAGCLSFHRHERGSYFWFHPQWLHTCECCWTKLWMCKHSGMGSLTVTKWPVHHRACPCTAFCSPKGTILLWLGRWWGRGERKVVSEPLLVWDQCLCDSGDLWTWSIVGSC